MHRSRLAVALPLAAALFVAVTGCASSAQPSTQSPPTATSAGTPEVTVSSSATTTPASAAVVTVSLDGAQLPDGSALDYSVNAVDAWTQALGTAPTQSPVEGPYGGDSGLTALEWPGLTLTVPSDGSTNGARVFVSSSTVAGHPIVTSEGLTVGSTRAEVLAAGAVEGFDSTELRLDTREVPGTQSLQHPGEVGREYVMVTLQGDSVAALHLPADDFSDI